VKLKPGTVLVTQFDPVQLRVLRCRGDRVWLQERWGPSGRFTKKATRVLDVDVLLAGWRPKEVTS
jgi:hypothetical protein